MSDKVEDIERLVAEYKDLTAKFEEFRIAVTETAYRRSEVVRALNEYLTLDDIALLVETTVSNVWRVKKGPRGERVLR